MTSFIDNDKHAFIRVVSILPSSSYLIMKRLGDKMTDTNVGLVDDVVVSNFKVYKLKVQNMFG